MFLERRERFDAETQGEGHVDMDAETGPKYCHKPGTPRTTSSHMEQGDRHGTDSLSELPEGTNPADTFTLDF